MAPSAPAAPLPPARGHNAWGYRIEGFHFIYVWGSLADYEVAMGWASPPPMPNLHADFSLSFAQARQRALRTASDARQRHVATGGSVEVMSAQEYIARRGGWKGTWGDTPRPGRLCHRSGGASPGSPR